MEEEVGSVVEVGAPEVEEGAPEVDEGRESVVGMEVLGRVALLSSATATASARMAAGVGSLGLTLGALRVMKENVGAIVVCRWAGEGVKWL